jgi:hypothetical protein
LLHMKLLVSTAVELVTALTNTVQIASR